MWKSLAQEEKDRYAALAAQDKERALKEFEESGGAAAFAAAQEEKKKKKEEEKGEKKPRKPRVTKVSPSNGFFSLFLFRSSYKDECFLYAFLRLKRRQQRPLLRAVSLSKGPLASPWGLPTQLLMQTIRAIWSWRPILSHLVLNRVTW
jgi:hypothetical protein